MNPQLSELIKKGENETLEFKLNFNDDVIVSLVAFANTSGGSVLIGITDQREVREITIGKETFQNVGK